MPPCPTSAPRLPAKTGSANAARLGSDSAEANRSPAMRPAAATLARSVSGAITYPVGEFSSGIVVPSGRCTTSPTASKCAARNSGLPGTGSTFGAMPRRASAGSWCCATCVLPSVPAGSPPATRTMFGSSASGRSTSPTRLRMSAIISDRPSTASNAPSSRTSCRRAVRALGPSGSKLALRSSSSRNVRPRPCHSNVGSDRPSTMAFWNRRVGPGLVPAPSLALVAQLIHCTAAE